MIEVVFLVKWTLKLALLNAPIVALMGLAMAASPGGAQLMFEGWMGDNAEVFVFDVERGLLRNLTNHPAQDVHPIWSPDGRLIAFESLRDGGRWVYVMDADGRNVRRLTTQKDFGEADPAWSADGRHVLFRGLRRRGSAIYRVEVATGMMERLDIRRIPRPVDTQRIVFMSYREGQWGIYVTNRTRTATYLLLKDMGFSETPHWSPDGARVAFISQSRYTHQVYVMDADGTDFRQVTFDRTLKIGLSWRP